MSTARPFLLPFVLLGLVVLLASGAIGYAVFAATAVTDGPADIVFDKAACAACGMHVGEPAFAAQVNTTDGRTHAFDDPGCLFLWLDENHPEIRSVWFHHHRERRWISRDLVAFVAVDKSPMGFGLAAVDANTPGAIGLDDARRRCLDRTSGHGGK